MTALLALELSFHELGMRVMQVATLLVLEMPLRELHMEVLRSLVGFATQEAMATLIGTRMAAGVSPRPAQRRFHSLVGWRLAGGQC